MKGKNGMKPLQCFTTRVFCAMMPFHAKKHLFRLAMEWGTMLRPKRG